MNARQLEIFRAIMRTGSVTDAARVLNVSQPTVSKVLLHMESQLGLKLFSRARGRLTPTPEAQLLFPDADRVFRDLAALRQLVNDLRAGDGGSIRIAASSSLAETVVPRALTRFRREHPRTKISSHLLPAAETAEMVRARAVDLGLTLSPLSDQTLHVATIGQCNMVAVMPVGHHLEHHSRITPRDLVDESLISFSSDTHFGRLLDEAFVSSGVTRQVAVEATMSSVAVAHVAAGGGVALVDRFATMFAPTGLVWRPFHPTVNLSVTLIESPNHVPSRLTRWLIEDLRHCVGILDASV
ncbi:LysR family transcriptional regulator [Acuticoccus sediminis]|uniref:LysR family transcriptional regulator n=1 Tax=Acuticoccus sediminis TaxID=2184697 RepID=A0A8B2NQD9_9HYPH|nr:LysR substrate-binding domain-containing protein [Acuticoccus sediminis]RAI02096.1 LysR family transcriptional regulator [Acuticoccus sediminis]